MRFEPYGTSSWWNEVPYGIAFFVVTLGAMFSTNGWVQWAIVVLTIASATWIAWMLWRRGTRARAAAGREAPPPPARVVLWRGRPGRDDQLAAARNWRRALIARAAAARDQAAAAGDLDAARQYAVQGLVVAAAQKSADQGGAFVRAFREPVLDPTPLAPADAELLEQMRARRRDL